MDRVFTVCIIAVSTFVIVAMEGFVGLGLFMAPGWANGWPVGISVQLIWSAVLSLVLFLILMTLTIGAGMTACLVWSWNMKKRRDIQKIARVGLLVGALAAISVSFAFGVVLYLAAWEMWPRGYDPSPVGSAVWKKI